MHAHRTQRRRAARLFEGLAELRRTPVRFAAHLAVARLVTQWRSLLTIIAGAILSASIGALVPLYTTAVAQVGMTQRLDAQPRQDVHIQSSISLRANHWAESGGIAARADAATELTGSLVARDLGAIEGWVDRVVAYRESEAMGIAQVMPDA